MARHLARLAACIALAALLAPVVALTFWQFPAALIAGGTAAVPALGLSLLPTFLAALLAHELGHAAAGSAVGLTFHSLMIPFLTVTKSGGRLRFRLNAATHKPLGMTRYTGLPGGLWRWAVFIAGGPVANFLLGAAVLVAACVADPGPPPRSVLAGPQRPTVTLLAPGDVLTAWLNLVGLLSVCVGLSELVPGEVHGIKTDGALILRALRGVPPTSLRIPGPTSAGAPRAAPDLAADAPDVPWTEDARRVLSRVEEEAEAAGDSYLGTHHLLLAAVATPPGATGVPGLNPAAVRAAVAAVVKAPRPAAEVAGTTRWPTPRLRRAITQAAMRALVNGRPLERRDLWHALLTDAGSDVCPILKRLGLDPEQLLELLA